MLLDSSSGRCCTLFVPCSSDCRDGQYLFLYWAAVVRLSVSHNKQQQYVYSCCSPRHTRGVDKSLARPTSRSLRTELIESLERGVCSCAELQVFFCYRS